MYQVDAQVVVTDPESTFAGKTGRVAFVQSDGTYLVAGLRSKVKEALLGWPALHSDQLQHSR